MRRFRGFLSAAFFAVIASVSIAKTQIPAPAVARIIKLEFCEGYFAGVAFSLMMSANPDTSLTYYDLSNAARSMIDEICSKLPQNACSEEGSFYETNLEGQRNGRYVGQQATVTKGSPAAQFMGEWKTIDDSCKALISAQ